MTRFSQTVKEIRNSLTDDSKRIELQFTWVYRILTAVSLFMTVVNIFTAKYILMAATAMFAALCILNTALAKKSKTGVKVSRLLFSAELITLLTFFIISGMPEGFSAIWLCLLPSSGLLLFQRKRGSALCALMLLIMIFFFQTPFGISFLHYNYTDSFRLRFPMLYLAFFAISFFLETLRAFTSEELRRTQKKYEYLYSHDALTDLYNRYGFNERLERAMQNPLSDTVAFMILDIDYFKKINDCYGHVNGDIALKKVAALISETVGNNAVVCRWGGEEFALLYKNGKNAETDAENLLCALRRLPIKLENEIINITASIGVVTAKTCNALDSMLMLKAADDCLYKAKTMGRNRVVCKNQI